MPEKVRTQTFSVPVAEAPAEYQGGFLDIALAKPAYAPGESIRMIVEVWALRSAHTFDLLWGSYIIAYNHLHTELTRVAASHMAIPMVEDYETYDVDLNLGKQPPEGLSGYLELWCEGSPEVKVATRSFGVPVITDGVEPPEEERPKKWVPWAIGGGLALAAIIAIGAAKKK